MAGLGLRRAAAAHSLPRTFVGTAAAAAAAELAGLDFLSKGCCCTFGAEPGGGEIGDRVRYRANVMGNCNIPYNFKRRILNPFREEANHALHVRARTAVQEDAALTQLVLSPWPSKATG